MNNILVVDDHKLFAAGMRSIIEQEFQVPVLSAVNATETLQILRTQSVDLVLMDIQMPDSNMNGIELTRVIKADHRETKVLVVSMDKSMETIDAVINAKANGYLVKDSGDETLLDAVKTIQSGKDFWDKGVFELLLEARKQRNETKAHPKSVPEIVLTKREIEVLEQLAMGLSSKEIAHVLCIGTSTVDTHRKNLIAKFGAKNSTEVVIKAKDMGLL